MPLTSFQPLCVLVLIVAFAAMSRLVAPRVLAVEYVALALAAWIGEESCIRLYGFYHYAPGWALRLDEVPVLVPLIWPLVILSARELGRALGCKGPKLIAWVLVEVTVDASLVEIIAVRAGFWTWERPGYLHVPLVGILGWGIFAAAAVWAIERGWRIASVIVAPVLTHAGLLLAWWCLFRWVASEELGSVAPLVVIAASVLATIGALASRRRVALVIMAPRMIAAGLFVAVLLSLPWRGPLLWHTLAVAAPYLSLTRF